MKLVAVTSCPTGIAHSQMAAENLEQTGESLGHEISVEVQGAMGTQDELTSEEITAADAVVIAADTSVKRDRFENKPLVKGTVKDAVNDAEGLIQEATELADSDASKSTTDPETPSEEPSPSQEKPTTRPEGNPKRGGDRSKGLFARLKRLLS